MKRQLWVVESRGCAKSSWGAVAFTCCYRRGMAVYRMEELKKSATKWEFRVVKYVPAVEDK